MENANIVKAGVLSLVLSGMAMLSWEFYLRHNDHLITYDDNIPLWANKRGMIYKPKDQETVFIGSSRIKYDLDIPTWESLTGENAVQLANQGSSPRPVLEDLANDKNFKGKLIIDVTEEIFFSEFSPNDAVTIKKIAYYHNITPTQRASFQINHALESQFVFLNQDEFSLNAMLDEWRLPHRAGTFPEPDFPGDFGQCTFERQSYMTPRFVADTSMQNRVKAIWAFLMSLYPETPISGPKLEAILHSVKTAVDKIKARGGEVIFIRTPSNGAMLEREMHEFPKAAYWDRLLATTGCTGIYYADYPAIAHFVCPEWSHLKPSDGIIFTKNLVDILQQEKGWSFNRKGGTL